MHRRTLLRSTGTLAALGLAGCTGDSDGGETDGTTGNGDGDGQTATDTPTPTETATDTPTQTATQTPAELTIRESSLSVTDTTSGQEVDAARTTVGADSVVVNGTIWGSDGCKTATLEGTEYDADSDTLRVSIVTTDRDDAGDACTEAIVEIDYSLRVVFSGAPPGSVEVIHDGRTVPVGDRADE